MPEPTDLNSVMSALGSSTAAAEELHKLCCDPFRSPRMQQVEDSLALARSGLADPATDNATVLTHLESAGSLIDELRVTCCTKERLPLYAALLEDLATARTGINQAPD